MIILRRQLFSQLGNERRRTKNSLLSSIARNNISTIGKYLTSYTKTKDRLVGRISLIGNKIKIHKLL